MSRRKPPSAFLNCETKEAFLVALQQELCSRHLTEAEFSAARLLCKMKGWDTPSSEKSEATVAPEVKTPGVAPSSGGDGMWHTQEDSGWSRGLTPEELMAKYNALADDLKAERTAALATGNFPLGLGCSMGRYVMIGVLVPNGTYRNLCIKPPCTVEKLAALIAEPDPRTVDHW